MEYHSRVMYISLELGLIANKKQGQCLEGDMPGIFYIQNYQYVIKYERFCAAFLRLRGGRCIIDVLLCVWLYFLIYDSVFMIFNFGFRLRFDELK